jgi:hypothetical protein
MFVMPGLVPGIHVFKTFARKTWMAATYAKTRFALGPAMTNEKAAEP